MRRAVRKWILGTASIGTFLTGCEPSGDYCDYCTDNSDCQPGLTCQEFRSDKGDRYHLCADNNPNGVCTIEP